MSSPFEALVEALGLKDVDRAGWVQRGVSPVESVAAHSWGVAWLAVVLTPDDLDLGRVLTYAALHDLPEVRVGDLTPADGVPADDKARRESAALDALTSPLPAHVAAAWHAYEAQGDPEGRWVRELDRLDMALQAVRYADDGHAGMQAFIDSAAKVVRHPRLLRLLDEARRALAAPEG